MYLFPSENTVNIATFMSSYFSVTFVHLLPNVRTERQLTLFVLAAKMRPCRVINRTINARRNGTSHPFVLADVNGPYRVMK